MLMAGCMCITAEIKDVLNAASENRIDSGAGVLWYGELWYGEV